MSDEEETRKRERWRQVGAILDAVLDAPPDSRERILAERCAGDPSLRDEVEALLAVESRPDRRLDSPVGVWANALLSGEEESATSVPGNAAGDRIGPYRLVRELGRGGMGTVWLAERADGQFEQQVALKLLKRGLDSEAILARFLEERRILASFRHPHIAQLFDGGIADDGRPYYALEYIDGALITKWCDGRRLGIRKRLMLFIDVVEAVQHAHQRLIVHRDLKPGNVMVSGEGEVKLLDFGIAKVLDAGQDGGSDAATLTRMGWRMLTPEYAAPEQLRGDPTTTATDVYALGVLLHELLTGCRPEAATGHEPETTKPPSRPSTCVTDEAATTRGGNPERLRGTLRGDLDVIVLKALQLEPERRYGSAQALADDIRRYLNGAPVRARPDSPWYRARRFVARHRWGVAAAALVVLSLAAGIVATSWQAREASRQAEQARKQTLEAKRQARRAEEIKTFLASLFQANNPEEWRGKEVTAPELLQAGAKRIDEELRDDPELHAEMLRVIGELYIPMQQLDKAEPLLRRSLDELRKLVGEDHALYAESLYAWAYLRYAQGHIEEAEKAVVRAADILRRRLGSHRTTAQAITGLAVMREVAGDTDSAIRLRREAIAIDRRVYGDAHAQIAGDLTGLGGVLAVANKPDEAEPLLREALATSRKLYGGDSQRVAEVLGMYARLPLLQGEFGLAASRYAEAITILRKGKNPGLLQGTLGNYGDVLCQLGRFDDAFRAFGESLRIGKDIWSRGHPEILVQRDNLSICLLDAGRAHEAERLLREDLSFWEREGPQGEIALKTMRNLARSLIDQGRLAEAEPLIRRNAAGLQKLFGKDAPETTSGALLLARWETVSGNPATALALQEQAFARRRQAYGPRDIRTTAASLDLATTQVALGRYAQAQSRLDSVMPALRKLGSDKAPMLLQGRLLSGRILAQRGQHAEAGDILRQVLQARRTMLGKDAADTAEAEIHLGACLARQGSEEVGRRLLQQGRSSFVRQRGGNHYAVRFADAELARLR